MSKFTNVVAIFDFDKTIIDCDSDNWVVDGLGFTDRFNHLLPTMPWNSMMDRLMTEMHAGGITIEEIEEVLKKAPIHEKIVPAIKSAHALGCELRVVSDANAFYIETILNHLGIRDCFTEINTNPSFVDEEGRLRISPYVDFTNSPHGCPLCPPNMCKGKIIERIQASMAKESKKKIIYLGDGAGDFCPSLKLSDGDFMMPRKNFPVWDLIIADRTRVKAEIHEWADGEDLARVLLNIIDVLISVEEIKAAENCKYQRIAIAAARDVSSSLPRQPLQVPQYS